MAPSPTRQTKAAFLPVKFPSALAKHGPVQTSQLRTSTYCPVISPPCPGHAKAVPINATTIKCDFSMVHRPPTARDADIQLERNADNRPHCRTFYGLVK